MVGQFLIGHLNYFIKILIWIVVQGATKNINFHNVLQKIELSAIFRISQHSIYPAYVWLTTVYHDGPRLGMVNMDEPFIRE